MSSSLLPSLLATALLAPLTAAGGGSAPAPLLDDFEGGLNQGGWIYNPGDVIESTGGNPGGWWHQPFADTFGPIVSSQSKSLAGDWRAGDVDRVAFDARLDHMDFGDGSGFQMTLLLRDTHGTVDIGDDDFAYFVGDNVPIEDTGWKHYEYAIPSADTSPLPSGWTGGHTGDSTSFRPGVDWNDVIESVDRVEIWWIDPALFAIFQAWDIGLDNIVIEAQGVATVRNGSGVNPTGFVSTSAPNLGTVWTSTVDLATPGHLASGVAISFGGPTEGVFPGGIAGELLVLPPFVVNVAAGSHAIPIPPTTSLLGTIVPTQGATIAADGLIHLNNALDVTIGA